MDFYIEKAKETISKNFIEIIKTQYVDFKGKTNFEKFGKYMTIYSAMFSIFYAFNYILPSLNELISILSMITSLALLLPTIAISVRRMRDVKISPWYLLFIFVPIIGQIYVITLLCGESEK